MPTSNHSLLTDHTPHKTIKSYNLHTLLVKSSFFTYFKFIFHCCHISPAASTPLERHRTRANEHLTQQATSWSSNNTGSWTFRWTAAVALPVQNQAVLLNALHDQQSIWCLGSHVVWGSDHNEIDTDITFLVFIYTVVFLCSLFQISIGNSLSICHVTIIRHFVIQPLSFFHNVLIFDVIMWYLSDIHT